MTYGTNLQAEFFTELPQLQLRSTEDGRSALLLLLELRTWSAHARTDGHVPSYALPLATLAPNRDGALELLADAGLLEVVEDGIQIDWSGQKTKDERDAQNAQWRQRDKHKRGDHSICPMTWTCRKAKTNSAATTPVAETSAPKKAGKPKPTATPSAPVTPEIPTAAAPSGYIDPDRDLCDDDGNLISPEVAKAYVAQQVRLTKAAVAGITAKATTSGVEFRCGADIYAIDQRGLRDRTDLEMSYRAAARDATYALFEAINDRSASRGWKLEEDELIGSGDAWWPMVFKSVWGELDRDSRDGLQAIIDGLAPQFEHLALVALAQDMLGLQEYGYLSDYSDLVTPYVLDAMPPGVKEAVTGAVARM
ncbi:hypothetical protein [Nocardia niigatensis]|uniref:hypothetical protein n=1 Tax=Nocardia niigatensis TaxID=209249 RepID=UPI0005940676|nr:hypothetical protein [Nocardia niigatensis]